MTAPATAPAASPAKTTQYRPAPLPQSSSRSVATTAMSMPTAPSWLARTAERGWLSPLKVRMNSTEATR